MGLNEVVKEFFLFRKEDVSGISGTGVVAVGCIFPSGLCVLEWLTFHSSVNHYKNFDDVEKIHGHNGSTEIILGSPEEYFAPKKKPRKKKGE